MRMAQTATSVIVTNATVYRLKRTSDQIPQTRVDGKAIPDMSIGAHASDKFEQFTIRTTAIDGFDSLWQLAKWPQKTSLTRASEKE